MYFDGASASFYVKRFSFDVSDNTPLSFISEAKGSYLVAVCDDRHPQAEIVFGGKYEHREAEKIDVEEFIAKKGLTAKGKRASQYELKSVRFIEPLVREEDLQEQSQVPPSEAENLAGEIYQDDIPDPIDEVSDDDQPTLF